MPQLATKAEFADVSAAIEETTRRLTVRFGLMIAVACIVIAVVKWTA